MRNIAAARAITAPDDRDNTAESSARIGRHILLADPLTGLYCRASCDEAAARDSNLARVLLSPAQAEREGFRPCPHCRPDRLPRAAATAGRDGHPHRLGHTLAGLFRALIFLP